MTVDLSKIRPGDEVTVRAVVHETKGPYGDDGTYDIRVLPSSFTKAQWVNPDAIVSHHPKALQPGDRARYGLVGPVDIRAVQGRHAWVAARPDDTGFGCMLSDLERIP